MDMKTAYENLPFIPDVEALLERLTESAFDFRSVEAAIGRARLNLPYGDHPRQAFDLYYPAGRPEGLVVFVHGGYWRRFDRTDWSHLAKGATQRGWAVAMPSYPLAPEVRISQITRDVAQAITASAQMVAGPILLTGHSAGGHLVARMVEADSPLPASVLDRVKRAVPISPLGDLRPLLQTPINDDLHLDMAEAEAESPILRAPYPGLAITVWVGAEERPVFVQQSRDLSSAWSADLRMAPGCHHMDVIDGLEEPESPMTRSLFGA